jgi:glutathione S-transferase
MTVKLTLYSVEGSGNCLKVRMLLGFLNIAYETVTPSLKPASEDLLAVNPLGQVPVLVINDEGKEDVIRDSNAILVYLALREKSTWFPVEDAIQIAKIQTWLSYGTSEVNHSLLWVRIKNKFSWQIPVSYEEALERARTVLKFIDSALGQSETPFLTGDEPNVADLSVFPYVFLAESSSDGVLKLADYPHVSAWTSRIVALPGLCALPPW